MKEKMELPRIIYQMFYFSQSPVIEWLCAFFHIWFFGLHKMTKEKNTWFLFWLWLGLQNLDILKVSCQVNSLESKMAGFLPMKRFFSQKVMLWCNFPFQGLYSWPWTTWIWTAQTHLHMHPFFFSINILGTFCWDLWLKKLTDEHIEMSRKVKEMTHA